MTPAHREGRNLVCLAVALWLMAVSVLAFMFGDRQDFELLSRKALAWWGR